MSTEKFSEQLIFKRFPSIFNGETIVYSTNGAGKTGFLNAKKQSWDPASHHVKLIQIFD